MFIWVCTGLAALFQFQREESGERNVWALVNWDNESFISVRGLKWSAPIGKQQFVSDSSLKKTIME